MCVRPDIRHSDVIHFAPLGLYLCIHYLYNRGVPAN